MLLNSRPNRSLRFSNILPGADRTCKQIYGKLPVAMKFIQPSTTRNSFLAWSAGSSFWSLLFLDEFVVTVQPVGWSADLTSLCFRFGASLYTILTGRFDFLTILWTTLSKWSEQNGRLSVALSELLSVSLVRETGSLFAFSQANSIVSLGKPFCWSKASIFLSLRCRAIGFDESATALRKCYVATDDFFVSGNARLEVQTYTAVRWLLEKLVHKPVVQARCPSQWRSSSPCNWQSHLQLCSLTWTECSGAGCCSMQWTLADAHVHASIPPSGRRRSSHRIEVFAQRFQAFSFLICP